MWVLFADGDTLNDGVSFIGQTAALETLETKVYSEKEKKITLKLDRLVQFYICIVG